MANCLKTREKEERRDRLYSTLTKNPGKNYSTKDIMNMLSVGIGCASRDMEAVAERDANIVKTRGFVTYIMPEETNRQSVHDIFFAKVEREGMDRYSANRNHEGYHDPTASAILKKEAKEEKMANRTYMSTDFNIGEVWNVRISSSDKCEQVIILGVNHYEDTVTVCPYDTSACRYYLKISTKPTKYFKDKVCGLPLSMVTNIKNKLTRYFGIEPEVKEVIKEVPVEVEKVVEKEVPMKTDKEFSQDEVDLMMSQQRAEIYEECFKLVAKKLA